MTLEQLTVWGAILAYAVSSILFIIGTFLGKSRVAAIAAVVAVAGAASHLVALVARSVSVGHLPAVGFYEVASKLAFLAVLCFLLLQWRFKGLRIAGVAVMPVSFLIVGATLLVSDKAQGITGALSSAWLVVHITFANLAFAFYVAGFVLAVTYLIRDSRWGQAHTAWLDRLPAQEVLDSITFKIVGAGFVFQGIMLASGSVWANEAWGSYWSWDPIETWALVAWVVYAVYLHLTLTMGWRGRRAAWVLVAAMLLISFSTLGVPIAYNSIHGAYMLR
jgi:cytochrome c-type biogenesis protein CcsB